MTLLIRCSFLLEHLLRCVTDSSHFPVCLFSSFLKEGNEQRGWWKNGCLEAKQAACVSLLEDVWAFRHRYLWCFFLSLSDTSAVMPVWGLNHVGSKASQPHRSPWWSGVQTPSFRPAPLQKCQSCSIVLRLDRWCVCVRASDNWQL